MSTWKITLFLRQACSLQVLSGALSMNSIYPLFVTALFVDFLIQTPGVPPVILHVHGPSLYRPYMCKHTDTWGPSCHTSCTSLYRPYMCKYTDTWGPSCRTSCTSLYRPYMCKHTDTWGPSCHTSCTSLYRPYMCKHTDTWGPSCHTSCTWTVSL